jgi:hypothetical protein
VNEKSRVTKERIYSEEKKRKNIRNHERGTGQLKNTGKLTGGRVNQESRQLQSQLPVGKGKPRPPPQGKIGSLGD